jgi:hypothetical protein
MLALVLLCVPAAADEVILTNGARFKGIVHEENDRIIIRFEHGTMSFHRSEARIVRSAPVALQVLESKTEKAASAQDWHAAALFAKENRLEKRVEALNERALELDPEHDGARTALGYAKVGGRWLKGDELLAALGYEKRGAHWVTKETAAAIDERLKAEEKARAEEVLRANQAAEAARAEEEKRRGLYAALEWEKLALERRRMEIEREVALKTAASGPGYAVGAVPYAGVPYGAAPYPGMFQGHDPACKRNGQADCCSRPWYYNVDRRGAGPPIKGPR